MPYERFDPTTARPRDEPERDDGFDPTTARPADESMATQAGANLREIPRQIGLTARYGLEAFGQTALPDIIGLPEPQNANERTVADASRLLIGAGGLAKGAQVVRGAIGATRPVLSGIAEAFSGNLGGQAGGAIGAGLAGGAVREAGGGPTEQFIASLLGGVAGAGAASGFSRGAQEITGWLARRRAAKDVKGALTVALERAGIDWQALSAQAKVQLVKDAEQAVYRGEPLDPQQIARLADFRNIGATPLRGDITQNPTDITLQRNLAKTQANMPVVPGPNLAQIENENAQRVLNTINAVEPAADDLVSAGQRVQGVVQAKDAAFKTTEDALYQAARDSAGRDLGLDPKAFVDEAFANLEANNRGPWLPAQVREVLNTLSSGKGSFDVNTIDKLKTLLAQESRATNNGNVKAAIAAVRDALENVQPRATGTPTGSTMPVARGAVQQAQARADDLAADTLGKFDAARRTARQRRTWQESAKFIEDALGEQSPEVFAKRHIVNADLNGLKALKAELNRDPAALAAVRKQLIDYILQRGRVDPKVVGYSSKGMDDALKTLGNDKLKLFFGPDEIQQIRSAINVARYSQAQPIGSAVNNSNSGAMLVGKMMDAVLAAGSKVPFVSSLVAEPLIGARIGLQARTAANIPNALLGDMPPQPLPLNPLVPLALLPSSNE